MICAWMETSSAEIGSSATMKSGSTRKCARNADALPLSTGELMREALDEAACSSRQSPSSCTRCSASLPLASLNVSRGSPMICPTVIRGLSEA